MKSDCRIPLPPPSSVCPLPATTATATHFPLSPLPPPPSSSVFLPPSLLSGCVSPPRCGHASWSKEEKKRGKKELSPPLPLKGESAINSRAATREKGDKNFCFFSCPCRLLLGGKLLFSFFSFWADPLFCTLGGGTAKQHVVCCYIPIWKICLRFFYSGNRSFNFHGLLSNMSRAYRPCRRIRSAPSSRYIGKHFFAINQGFFLLRSEIRLFFLHSHCVERHGDCAYEDVGDRQGGDEEVGRLADLAVDHEGDLKGKKEDFIQKKYCQ